MTISPVLIPVEEYLHTSYSPDCDYVDGEIQERNLGETPHSSVQKFFIVLLSGKEKAWGIRVLPEQRIQVSESRYRVADVAVVRRATALEPVVMTPPLLCIEIVSPEDRLSRLQERVHDYIRMGVQTVWVVDPRRRTAYLAEGSETLQVETEALTVSRTEIRVEISQIFFELDELEAIQ